MKQRLLKSYFQAGFECSTHRIKTGDRLDLVSSTNHDKWVAQAFQRCAEMGILSAREGIRWHLIQPSPGKPDFSTALTIMRAAEKAGVQVMWDLCHFGWPDYLDVFSEDWVKGLAELAHGFARLLRQE